MTAASEAARERIVEAAFALFDERGYAATTVDQIAERAGVSRSTFFRMFASKEDVIFPDHDDLHGRIQARLAAAERRHAASWRSSRAPGWCSTTSSPRATWRAARYRLTRTVPALRDREIAGMHGYQKLFRDFITHLDAGCDRAPSCAPS